MSGNSTISVGDFVEIEAPFHHSAGKRGYVIEKNGGTLRILFDELVYEDRTTEAFATGLFTQPKSKLYVRSQDLKVVRGHEVKVTTRVCDYTTAKPPCLGMIASSFTESKIDPQSALGKLPRPSAQELPGIPSMDALYRTKEGERVVKEIYQGSFVVEWHHSFKLGDVLSATPHYSMIVLVPKDGDGASLLPVGTLELSSRVVSSTYELFNVWSGDLKLTSNQKDFMGWRVIHHLLRVAGCDIGYSSFDLLKSIFDQYKARNWWPENVDIALVWADNAVQTGQSTIDIIKCLHLLGEALEAMKKYLKAAGIYGQLGEFASRLLNKLEMVNSCTSQGIAYKRGREFGMAEDAFLRGLRQAFTTSGTGASTFDHGMVKNCMLNLHSLYDDWDDIEYDDKGTSSVEKINTMFLGTLLVAQVHPMYSPDADRIFASKYRSKIAMRTALIQAFQTASVRDFRAAILSLKDPKAPPLTPFRSGAVDTTNKFIRKQEKKTARETAVETATMPLAICDNPTCPAGAVGVDVDVLRPCSRCRDARYCSKECQVAHWKVHKQSCFEIGGAT